MIDPTCSFCGKKQRDVARLLGKPETMICDECVQHYVEVMIRHPGQQESREWLARLKRRIARTELEAAQ
jgi:ATP-dependent protease Clp ATPase subunit